MVKKGKAGAAQRGVERKARARSHVRHGAVEWSRLLREQQRSGLTVEAFCGERGLARSTFWHWRRRVEVATAQVPKIDSVPTFLAVPVSAPGESIEVMAGDLRVWLEGMAAQRVLEAIVARLAGAA